MDAQKFKDMLIKISNVKLEKPSQIAKLKEYQSEAAQLKVQFEEMLSAIQKIVSASQSYSNKKMNQLLDIQNKSREKWHEITKKVSKLKNKNQLFINTSIKAVKQFQQQLRKKSKILHSQLKAKNENYLDILNQQLEVLQLLREKVIAAKSINYRNYEKWMENGLIKADKILMSQQKDIKLIEGLERSFVEKCDALEEYFSSKFQDQIQSSNQREKLIFRKLEMLIGDINLD